MFRVQMGTALQSQLEGLSRLRNELPGLIRAALSDAGNAVVQDLASAAPRGQGGGTPPEGDAPGPLAESFSAVVEDAEGETVLTVKTTQPTKLMYVTEGTGIYGPYGERIYPKVKQALYWEGAEHPVKSVAGQEANDFVSPITDEADGEITDQVAEAIYEAMQEAADV